MFWGLMPLLRGHWYPYFGLLLTFPGVSKLEWAALFTLGGGVYDICSFRFTSGVTPATSWRPTWQLVTSPHACSRIVVRCANHLATAIGFISSKEIILTDSFTYLNIFFSIWVTSAKNREFIFFQSSKTLPTLTRYQMTRKQLTFCRTIPICLLPTLLYHGTGKMDIFILRVLCQYLRT